MRNHRCCSWSVTVHHSCCDLLHNMSLLHRIQLYTCLGSCAPVLLVQVTTYLTAFCAKMMVTACCVLQESVLLSVSQKQSLGYLPCRTLSSKRRGLLHAFIKQAQWKMPNKRATKCDQHPPVFSTVLSCIALLTGCNVFDVYRASQACDHRHSLHLQYYAPCLPKCQLSM